MTHSESRSLPWIRHQLVELRRQLLAFEQEQAALLAAVAAPYRASARNLLHFSAFHLHNHPGLQLALRQRGLSTLAGCDPHLLASLNSLMAVVLHLCGSRDDDAPPNGSEPPISLGQGHAQGASTANACWAAVRP
jgi:pyruvate kinase